MRVVYKNIGDSAQYFPSSTVSGYPIENVFTDIKGNTFRGGTTLNILATWATTQTLSCLVFPNCSLTNGSTVRIRLYSDALGSVLILDTGVITMPTVDNYPVGAGIYTYSVGGGFTRALYFAKTSGVIRASIDLYEPNIGYIELSRIVMGEYWQSKVGVEYGYTVDYVDNSITLRTNANTLVTDAHTRTRVLKFVLPYLSGSDLTTYSNIMRLNQMHVPMFVSLFPGDPNVNTEHMYQVYGKVSQMPDIIYPSNGHFTSNLEIEEI